MGFTTGFTGGVTLTLGVAYLTALAHERNRQAQAQALRSQANVLNGLFEPTPFPPPQSRAELVREERSTLVETAKDRWNAEIENAVRWVQRTDWNEVREGVEGSVARLLGTGLEKSREGIEDVEKNAGPKVQEAVDRSKAAARQGGIQAAASIDKAAAAAVSGAENVISSTKDRLRQAGTHVSEVGSAAKPNTGRVVANAKSSGEDAVERIKAKTDQAVANTKSGAQEAADKIRHSGGTVDAARDAVRDTVSRGIEKGKEAIGKVQAAVGLSTDKLESKAQASNLSHSSEVEKALHERYEKPDGLNKSVEETLGERYKPIEARDNTVLRGV